jgi:cytochrome c-type biogenesis protein CcmH
VAGNASAGESQPTLPDIEDEVMCPICGTSLELSESPQAERERDLIRRLIAQGKSKAAIKEILVAEYGEEVLASPEGEGFDLTAWVTPIAAGLGAIIALLVAAARLRRAPSPSPPPSLDAADRTRLERDMASHESG